MNNHTSHIIIITADIVPHRSEFPAAESWDSGSDSTSGSCCTMSSVVGGYGSVPGPPKYDAWNAIQKPSPNAPNTLWEGV